MENNNQTVSVLIPTLKRLDILEQTLGAVAQMNVKPFEVLVVCRPKDDPETYLFLKNAGQEFSFKLVIVEIDVPGVVQALNKGIDNTKGDIVAIFDDDALPRADWLDKILDCYKDPMVAAVGGRDLVHTEHGVIDKPLTTVAGVRTFFGNFIGKHHLVEGKVREVDVLKGCDMSFRRSVLGSLRLDERLIGNGAQIGNESWFILGFKRAGWKVMLEPNAIVDHYPAIRHDIGRSEWTRARCFENATNNVALSVAYLDTGTKFKFILFHLIVGFRYCPGLYYFAHGLLKRPKMLPGIMLGGWSGFFTGLKLAKEFEKRPPGLAASAPSQKGRS